MPADIQPGDIQVAQRVHEAPDAAEAPDMLRDIRRDVDDGEELLRFLDMVVQQIPHVRERALATASVRQLRTHVRHMTGELYETRLIVKRQREILKVARDRDRNHEAHIGALVQLVLQQVANRNTLVAPIADMPPASLKNYMRQEKQRASKNAKAVGEALLRLEAQHACPPK